MRITSISSAKCSWMVSTSWWPVAGFACAGLSLSLPGSTMPQPSRAMITSCSHEPMIVWFQEVHTHIPPNTQSATATVTSDFFAGRPFLDETRRTKGTFSRPVRARVLQKSDSGWSEARSYTRFLRVPPEPRFCSASRSSLPRGRVDTRGGDDKVLIVFTGRFSWHITRSGRMTPIGVAALATTSRSTPPSHSGIGEITA